MKNKNMIPEKEYKPTEELESKEGYVRDFLTNRLIRLTPEEQVRQIMLMRLVQEYEYPKEWIKTEFEIQKGSKRIGPADIVVFRKELKNENYLIFMAVVEKIGYDLNSKTPKVMYKKDERGEIIKDKNGEPIIDTDMPAVMEAFREFKKKYSFDF